ncbi:MAG: hypothetical protein H3Z50_02955 [archaeon]|nr:hypothetical protein [archaeon]MCP8306817.1 hypothetical protein [archaeon]
MVTKVSVDIPICGKKAMVTAEKDSSSKIDIIIESDCEYIRRLAENLKEIDIKDACMSFDENPIFISAKNSNVTVTCLVPCAIVNAVWVEAGLISRSLTQDEKTRELKLRFL